MGKIVMIVTSHACLGTTGKATGTSLPGLVEPSQPATDPQAGSHLRRLNGHVLLEGKLVTECSNAEENAVGLERIIPFFLEDALREAGAHYHCAQPCLRRNTVLMGRCVL